MIVAQVIDAVIAARLTRGPGASSPNDPLASTVVPTLRIADESAGGRRCWQPPATRPRHAGKAWCREAACLREAAMRYSGWALLLFGAGGVLGLVLVSANLTALGWTASATMAA